MPGQTMCGPHIKEVERLQSRIAERGATVEYEGIKPDGVVELTTLHILPVGPASQPLQWRPRGWVIKARLITQPNKIVTLQLERIKSWKAYTPQA